MAEIGDLCQLYMVSPVMVLDDVHRQDQANMSTLCHSLTGTAGVTAFVVQIIW